MTTKESGQVLPRVYLIDDDPVATFLLVDLVEGGVGVGNRRLQRFIERLGRCFELGNADDGIKFGGGCLKVRQRAVRFFHDRG